MFYGLCGLCALLVLAVGALAYKIALLRRAAEDIHLQFAARLESDTNVGIDIATRDRAMRRLASDIDVQLALLRKAHIRYARGDNELKEAITNIAHDLRTPLTAMCGYMDLLGREDMGEAARGYLAIIANRVEALKRLSEELFQYSVTVSGSPNEGLETVSVRQAVEECVAGCYGALKERGIVPEILLPEARVERRLNRVALSRILVNILSNALKYSDGDLHIDLTEQGVVTFSNHAARLDEVSVGRLFDRFFTVHNGMGGTGLGLSIAKLLIERMGGGISALKDGDIFAVTLRLPGP